MEIEPILRALFGPAASQRYRQVDADALREAYVAARNEKNAAVIARAKPNPAGERWGTRDDQLVIDRSTRATDKNAALEPLHQQLQAAIARMAAELVEPAKRLLNSRTWRGLAGTAAAFRDVVDGDPQEMPERLGNAYALLLRLGRFLETDVRLQRDTAALDDPLDPDIHGLLTDVVRTAAPWLRGFPTVAAWDDAAGKALVRADLFQPAREFTRIAQAQQAISEMDAAEMEQLAEAADVSDYQGQKAGNRAVGSAQNLIIAAARVVSPSLLKTDISSNPLLVQRAGTTLTAAVDQVEAFAAALPVDVAQALRALVEEVLRRTSKPLPVEPSMDLPLPDDIEEQARAMILEGHAPPAAWCPFIHTLSFHGTTLDNLELLVGLTALQSLDVDLTPVSDVSPLAELIALRSLDLGRTRVRDVSPLAGLTALESLDLGGTEVGDVSPLAGLTALQSLYLGGTAVSDASPLAGLTALQSLYLSGTAVSDASPLARLTVLESLDFNGTEVSDVSPLARLTALRSLDLNQTRVSDVSPLARLTALRSLDLNGTEVIDVSPLARLTALRSLDLNGTLVSDASPLAWLTALQFLHLDRTQVSDVAPFAGLTALQSLHLDRTQVSAVSPLARLTALQSLDLGGTRVSDPSPLAGLTALQSLDLSDTRVSDVSPLAGLTALQSLILSGTQVTDMSPLSHIRDLQIIAPFARVTVSEHPRSPP